MSVRGARRHLSMDEPVRGGGGSSCLYLTRLLPSSVPARLLSLASSPLRCCSSASCGSAPLYFSSVPRAPRAAGGLRGGRPSPGGVLLGSASRAVVVRVWRALSGFAARGGRCCMAPGPVPWLWPAGCLSGVPRGPALVRRASSSPVALGAPVGFPVAVVPSPTPGAVASGFTGRLRGARGGRPRTGFIGPAACPCRGRGAGLAPRRTRTGPRDGVVPGRSLRLRSWAGCAAVVWRVWTRSLTRPVSCTVRRSTEDWAGAQGLFPVDADTSPFGWEDATPGSRACVRVPALLGRVGRVGHPGALQCGSPFLWPIRPAALLSPLRAWVALVVFFCFFCFFVSIFFFAPRCLCPRCLRLFVLSGPGCPWPLALSFPSAPPPPPPAHAPPLFVLLFFLSLVHRFFCYFFFFLFPPPPPPPPPRPFSISFPLLCFSSWVCFFWGGFRPPLLCVRSGCRCAVRVLLLARWGALPWSRVVPCCCAVPGVCLVPWPCFAAFLGACFACAPPPPPAFVLGVV